MTYFVYMHPVHTIHRTQVDSSDRYDTILR